MSLQMNQNTFDARKYLLFVALLAGLVAVLVVTGFLQVGRAQAGIESTTFGCSAVSVVEVPGTWQSDVRFKITAVGYGYKWYADNPAHMFCYSNGYSCTYGTNWTPWITGNKQYKLTQVIVGPYSWNPGTTIWCNN